MAPYFHGIYIDSQCQNASQDRCENLPRAGSQVGRCFGTTSQWTTREIRAAAIVPPLHGLGQTIVLMPNKPFLVLARPSDIDFRVVARSTGGASVTAFAFAEPDAKPAETRAGRAGLYRTFG
jgi:hypothetical protein